MSAGGVISGDKALLRKFKKLSGKEGKKAIRKPQRPSIKPIQQQAKSNASRNRKTGTLEKSVKIRSMKRSRSRIGVRVTSGVDSGFPGEFHGAFVEFDREGFEGQKNFQQAAQQHQRQVVRNYSRAVVKNVIELAKNG